MSSAVLCRDCMSYSVWSEKRRGADCANRLLEGSVQPERLVHDGVEIREAVVELVVRGVAAAAKVRQLLFAQFILKRRVFGQFK